MDGPRRARSLAIGFRIGLPVLGALGLLLALRGPFASGWIDLYALSPAVVAGVCWGGQLWYAGRSLDRDPEADPDRGADLDLDSERAPWGAWRRLFGVANALTLLRGALYAAVAGFVVVPPGTALAWVPAVAYGTGAALDKLDGTVARTVGRETALGRRLDMAFDTFGFVAAPLVAVLWGQLPVWYLSLSAARYVYRAGLAWRRRRDRPVFDLPDGELSRYLAGVQMAFLTLALAPVVPTGLVWTAAPFVLLPSLSVFARDFLIATGRLRRGR
ncbi:MAG: CDP-alcohol phosphatidyltransferase family protein [Haloferacaceae archaeon]